MAKGKQTCKILKEIRKQIAAENDIELVVSECTYQGDCLGTCPKCEAEVRYLERELEKRQRLGKAAVFAGMSMGTLFAATGCNIIQPLAGMPMDPPSGTEVVNTDTIPEKPLAGDVVAIMPERPEPDTIIEEPLMGIFPMFRAVYAFDADTYKSLLQNKFVFSGMEGMSVVSGEIEYEHAKKGKACESLEELAEAATEFKAPYCNEGERGFREALASEIMAHFDRDKIEGDMEVAFTVEATGDVREVKIEKGIDKELDAVVAAAFKKVPWHPASYTLKGDSWDQPFSCRCVKKISFPFEQEPIILEGYVVPVIKESKND